MRIALFGGSFDPPHLGHKTVANTVVAKKIADQVWFVPCANHPFAKELSSANHRLAMLQLLGNYQIYAYEIEKDTKSYSIETLEHAAAEFPQHTFVWLMGSDQLKDFHKWNRYEDIVNKFGVLVYPRKGYALEPLIPGMKALHEVPEVGTSSTEIRNAVKEQKSLESLTLPTIARYIEEHGLYSGK